VWRTTRAVRICSTIVREDTVRTSFRTQDFTRLTNQGSLRVLAAKLPRFSVGVCLSVGGVLGEPLDEPIIAPDLWHMFRTDKVVSFNFVQILLIMLLKY
jgi:hypothetical protein